MMESLSEERLWLTKGHWLFFEIIIIKKKTGFLFFYKLSLINNSASEIKVTSKVRV